MLAKRRAGCIVLKPECCESLLLQLWFRVSIAHFDKWSNFLYVSTDARVLVLTIGECGGRVGFLQRQRNPGFGRGEYFEPVLHLSGLCFPCENLILCPACVYHGSGNLSDVRAATLFAGSVGVDRSLLVRAAGFRAGCSTATSYEVWYLVDPTSSICLSQRLSHACLSTSRTKVKPRMAH